MVRTLNPTDQRSYDRAKARFSDIKNAGAEEFLQNFKATSQELRILLEFLCFIGYNVKIVRESSKYKDFVTAAVHDAFNDIGNILINTTFHKNRSIPSVGLKDINILDALNRLDTIQEKMTLLISLEDMNNNIVSFISYEGANPFYITITKRKSRYALSHAYYIENSILHVHTADDLKKANIILNVHTEQNYNTTRKNVEVVEIVNPELNDSDYECFSVFESCD